MTPNRLSLLFLLISLTAGFAVAGGDEVVAVVGDGTILRWELDDAVQMATSSQYFHRRLTPEKRRQLEQEQTKILIRQKLDFLAAQEHEITPDMELAEQERADFEARAGARDYPLYLEYRGLTKETHRQRFVEQQMAAAARRRFVTEPAQVSDAEVKAAFEDNPELWTMPEAIHLQHIYLAVSEHAPAAAWEEQENKAAEAMRRLNAGEDFGAVAEEYSLDRYRIQGGDVGWVHRGGLIQPLEDAVWQAKVLEIVGPVRSAGGFHIARPVEKKAAQQMEFEQAESLLRARLEEQRLTEAENRWYGDLKSRHPVVVLKPDLTATVE